jgi:hypothetical protein
VISWFSGKFYDLRMNKINKEWHLANKMPKNPSIEQRVIWHLEHSKHCQCRPLGGKILEEIKKRGLLQ